MIKITRILSHLAPFYSAVTFSNRYFHKDYPGKVLTGPHPVAITGRVVAVLLAASLVSKGCVTAAALEAPCSVLSAGHGTELPKVCFPAAVSAVPLAVRWH